MHHPVLILALATAVGLISAGGEWCGAAAVVRPEVGVAIGLMIRTGRRSWPIALTLLTLLAPRQFGALGISVSWTVALAWGAIGTLQTILVATLLRRYWTITHPSATQFAKGAAITIGISLITAVAAALMLNRLSLLPSAMISFGTAWLTGDLVGTALFLPAFWWSARMSEWHAPTTRSVEVVGLAVLCGVGAWIAQGSAHPVLGTLLLAPLLLVSGIRLGHDGLALALLGIGVTTAVSINMHHASYEEFGGAIGRGGALLSLAWGSVMITCGRIRRHLVEFDRQIDLDDILHRVRTRPPDGHVDPTTDSSDGNEPTIASFEIDVDEVLRSMEEGIAARANGPTDFIIDSDVGQVQMPFDTETFKTAVDILIDLACADNARSDLLTLSAQLDATGLQTLLTVEAREEGCHPHPADDARDAHGSTELRVSTLRRILENAKGYLEVDYREIELGSIHRAIFPIEQAKSATDTPLAPADDVASGDPHVDDLLADQMRTSMQDVIRRAAEPHRSVAPPTVSQPSWFSLATRASQPKSTVLIAQANLNHRAHYVTILERMGFETILTQDAASALRGQDLATATIRLVVVDELLPDRLGLDLIRAMRTQQPRLPAMLIATKRPSPEQQRSLDASDDIAWIVEPVASDVIESEARRLIGAEIECGDSQPC